MQENGRFPKRRYRGRSFRDVGLRIFVDCFGNRHRSCSPRFVWIASPSRASSTAAKGGRRAGGAASTRGSGTTSRSTAASCTATSCRRSTGTRSGANSASFRKVVAARAIARFRGTGRAITRTAIASIRRAGVFGWRLRFAIDSLVTRRGVT